MSQREREVRMINEDECGLCISIINNAVDIYMLLMHMLCVCLYAQKFNVFEYEAKWHQTKSNNNKTIFNNTRRFLCIRSSNTFSYKHTQYICICIIVQYGIGLHTQSLFGDVVVVVGVRLFLLSVVVSLSFIYNITLFFSLSLPMAFV